MELQIEINQKKYNLLFGYGAIERLCEKLNIDLDEIDNKLFSPISLIRIKSLKVLIVSAVENFNEKNKVHQDISEDDINSHLDNHGGLFLETVLNGFIKSNYLGKTVANWLELEQEKQEDPKKKVTRKKV